jgi:hypothetical protein
MGGVFYFYLIGKKPNIKYIIYNFMELDKYFELYDNNVSGKYTTEKWLKEKAKNILDTILEQTGDTLSEKAYRLRFKISDTPLCPTCNKPVRYKNKTIGFQKYCSISCGSKGSKEKAINTIFEEYGVYHPSQIPKNILRRKNKRIESLINLIGKAKLVNIIGDLENESYEIKCDLCNKTHTIERKVIEQRIYLGLDWRSCISQSFSVSNGEIEIRDFIKSIYKGDIIYNNRDLIGSEIDIFITEFNLGIEYNGLYWHSEINKCKSYHYDKYRSCLDKEITLIQIYEDEWKKKQNIVKSRIRNLLKLSENKIYARNCTIREIRFSESNKFLIDNHLQGSIKSSINIGLFYANELVSLMTFGKPRGNMSNRDSLKTYELYRFCNKLNTNVVGSGSKLFKYFTKKYSQVDFVYSFSANEWSGRFYNKIGMSFKSESKTSYWYIKNHSRVSRHNFNKTKLVKMGYDKNKSEHEILKDLKIYRIYGAGNSKFIWSRKI